jgi:hypothetical protein
LAAARFRSLLHHSSVAAATEALDEEVLSKLFPGNARQVKRIDAAAFD